MRESIPLALSDKITFTFDRTHKWNCEMAEEGRTRKKEEAGIKEKLGNMREKLEMMQIEDDQLR
jgi:hypothetical protein